MGLKVAQVPDPPTTCPRSFMLVATPSGSEGGKLVNSAAVPDDGLKVQHLGRGAPRVANRVLGVAGHFAKIVDPGGHSVVAAERRQRGHDIVFPLEGQANHVGSKAAKVFAVGVGS